ncbi:MAG TPA: hypothetical protein VGJ51_18465 [Candidatus Angelobacter sp.]|jgi:organic radical activating enzyme
MKCTLREGKIWNETLEINVAHHCNLTCRGCSHLSPVLPKSYCDKTELGESLRLLAQYYVADHVRLLGGEPLLHPDLAGVLETVRQSGISERIRVVSNGILLGRAGESFWSAIDELHVSIYPGHEPTTAQQDAWTTLARKHNVSLKLLYFEYFRESYSELGTGDKILVQRIYNTCQVVNQWRCHTLEQGSFYKCPQSIFIARMLGFADPRVDGIHLASTENLGESLLRYLESPEPLQSCRNCLGTTGLLFPHSSVPRHSWRNPQRMRSEELVDYEFLHTLESVDPNPDIHCVRLEVLTSADKD